MSLLLRMITKKGSREPPEGGKRNPALMLALLTSRFTQRGSRNPGFLMK